MNSLEAAKQLGEALRALVDEGVCDEFMATQALMCATPIGGTEERSIALDHMTETNRKEG